MAKHSPITHSLLKLKFNEDVEAVAIFKLVNVVISLTLCYVLYFTVFCV